MKKAIKIIFSVIAIIVIAVASMNITGYFVFNDQESQETLRLGYCPTMYEYAKILAEHENYEIIELNSAAFVLSALNQGDINAGLIGRKAKQNEISGNIRETVLETGHTLVSNQRYAIDVSEVSFMTIHTYLDAETAENILPYGSNIIYHNSKQDALNQIRTGNPVLISWDDWEDSFELIVVIRGMLKAEEFRGVFLYSF